MAHPTCGHLVAAASAVKKKINCGPSGACGRGALHKAADYGVVLPRCGWPPQPLLPIAADYKGFSLISKFPLRTSIPLFRVFFFPPDVPLDLAAFRCSYQSEIRKAQAGLRLGPIRVLMYLCSRPAQYDKPPAWWTSSIWKCVCCLTFCSCVHLPD